MSRLHTLPPDLPRPVDDGACRHLAGMAMPKFCLSSTSGRFVDVGAIEPGRTIIYCYPKTDTPSGELPESWDSIPGARGCTPQACAFRDHAKELSALGARLFGLSTQTTAYQLEMAKRLHLPFEILSDSDFGLTDALRLPTFAVGPERLLKRLTLVLSDGVIEHAFYPVFPPDKHASQVVRWLRSKAA